MCFCCSHLSIPLRRSRFLYLNSEVSTWPMSGSSQSSVGWGLYRWNQFFTLCMCAVAFFLPKGWTVMLELGMCFDQLEVAEWWIMMPVKSFMHPPATLVPLSSLWEHALADMLGEERHVEWSCTTPVASVGSQPISSYMSKTTKDQQG